MPKRLPYRLFNEDAIEVMSRLGEGSIDLILVDPPYGTTACKWDSVINLERMWSSVWRILRADGAAVFTATQPFTSVLVCSQPARFKYELIWEKASGTGFLDAKFRPLKVHESILAFSRAGCSNGSNPAMTYRPQMTEGKPYKVKQSGNVGLAGSRSEQRRVSNEYGPVRYPKSVLKFNHDNTGLHPTQKPVALMEYLIRTFTDEGQIVSDFCMGSGTTGVACANSNRRFIGVDSDKTHGYFELAKNRISKAYGVTND